MDRHIKENLEEYMRGAMEPAAQAEFEKRLQAGGDEDVRLIAEFRQHAQLIRETYRAADEARPAPGFYGRVMDRIQAQRPQSIWSAFLEPQFFRRLALASATLLVLLGLTIFNTGPEEATLASMPAPAMDAMTEQEPGPVLGENQEQDRDAILVNLATYQETQSF
jgi:hypothetical protein